MRVVHVLIAAGLLALSSTGSAKVIFCNAQSDKVRYYTPHIDIGENEDAGNVIRKSFENYLAATHPSGRWDVYCSYERNWAASDMRLDTFKYNNKDVQWILTDFTAGYPVATANSGTSEPKGNGQALTIQKTGPTLAEAVTERTARELEGQRAAAAANAKRVADAARSQAETKAKIDKFIADLKKRGSAQ